MPSAIEIGYCNAPAHLVVESARADEPVSHGRAHLAAQRVIAAANLHRDDTRMMRHEGKDAR